MNGISDMNQSFIERRRHPRKDIFLVMEIERRNQPESRFCVVTNNISASGVYFKTMRGGQFTPDIETDFTLFLSAPVPNGKSCINSIQGSGRVVRCEKPDENTSLHEENNSRWSGIAIQFGNPLKIDSSSFSFR
jgi:hypothetical protein